MDDLNTRYNNGEHSHLIGTGVLIGNFKKASKKYQGPVLWACL